MIINQNLINCACKVLEQAEKYQDLQLLASAVIAYELHIKNISSICLQNFASSVKQNVDCKKENDEEYHKLANLSLACYQYVNMSVWGPLNLIANFENQMTKLAEEI